MDKQKVSINEIRERYTEEEIELSVNLIVKMNLAICPSHDKNGERSKDMVMVTFFRGEDENDYFAHGYLEPGWDIDSLAKAFQISPDDEIWRVDENI